MKVKYRDKVGEICPNLTALPYILTIWHGGTQIQRFQALVKYYCTNTLTHSTGPTSSVMSLPPLPSLSSFIHDPIYQTYVMSTTPSGSKK